MNMPHTMRSISHQTLIAVAGAAAPEMTASVFTTTPIAPGFLAGRERMPGSLRA